MENRRKARVLSKGEAWAEQEYQDISRRSRGRQPDPTDELFRQIYFLGYVGGKTRGYSEGAR